MTTQLINHLNTIRGLVIIKTDQPLKYYSGSSDYIKEYDYKTDQPLKYYSGSGGYIKEYDYKTDQPLKYYFF